jgi:hypothetical protein
MLAAMPRLGRAILSIKPCRQDGVMDRMLANAAAPGMLGPCTRMPPPLAKSSGSEQFPLWFLGVSQLALPQWGWPTIFKLS